MNSVHDMKPGPIDQSDRASVLLLVIRGRYIGRRIELDDAMEELTVGRDPEAFLSLSDESASRHHCRLSKTPSGWFIEDLNSTNGTYIDHQLIDRAPLQDGDLIKVGSTIMKFLANDDLEAAYQEEMYRLAIFDGLTQIPNRRYLDDFVEREMSRCRRHRRTMTLLMFDIDGFRRINTRFGHLAGDHVLQQLSAKISRRIRREELFARYGGDEFAIVLPETSCEDALKFAEIIRHTIEVMEFRFDGWSIPVTVSLGVGQYLPTMNSPADLFGQADLALHQAKSQGDNQVSARVMSVG